MNNKEKTFSVVGFEYAIFRMRLANAMLATLINSISHVGIILLVSVGILVPAFIAIGLFYAPLLSWQQAVFVVSGQSVLTALPIIFLKRQLYPDKTRAWLASFPITNLQKWLGNAAATFIVMRWLAVCYVVSAFIWLYQLPKWLRPIWQFGVINIFIVVVASFILGCIALEIHIKQKPSKEEKLIDFSKVHAWNKWKVFIVLMACPYTRKGFRGIAIRQMLIFCFCLLMLLFWMAKVFDEYIPNFLMCMGYTISTVILIALGDSALKKQLENLTRGTATWPFSISFIHGTAQIFAFVPSLFLMCLFWFFVTAFNSNLSMKVAILYMAISALSSLIIIRWTQPGSQGRSTAAVLTIAVLSAIGSELWI